MIIISLETSCIRTEESLKYSIDIGIVLSVLDEMKYGIAWIRSLAKWTHGHYSVKLKEYGFQRLEWIK